MSISCLDKASGEILNRNEQGFFTRDRALHFDATDHLICTVLRGENPAWPRALGEGFSEAFLERSRYHGVQALLYERLHVTQDCPPIVLDALHRKAIAQAMWELRHQQLLTQALAALVPIGIEPIIFKGTALAYSLYANPMLRARGDTDLIVRPQARSQGNDALTALGFVPAEGVSGELIFYGRCYAIEAPDSGVHALDLHWRISNSELLSQLFSYEELQSQAVPLPHLCDGAVAAGAVHALLLACMHRAVHKQAPYYVDGIAHYSANRLIWLYDIHLLATALSSAQWHELVHLARDKELCATCLDGIERARACFHTGCPEFVLADLAGSGAKERPATYLNAGWLRREWMDFCAIDGLSGQLRFLQELILPPAAYMRAKYPEAKLGWLPWLYTRRALDGFVKRLGAYRRTS